MKIFKYLKPYWYLALFAALTMVGEVLMDLFLPKVTAEIVNVGLQQGHNEIILRSGLLMVGLAIVGGAFGFASAIFASAASQKFADDLRRDVFKKVMDLSFQQTDEFSTGSLVTRITNDIDLVKNLVASSVRMFVRTLMLFVGGIIFLLMINVQFGYVLLISLPIEVVIIVIFVTRVAPLFLQVQERLDDVNATMQENVAGSRVVKAYNREEFEAYRFNDANVRLANVSLKVQKIMAILSPILMITMNITIIVIIYLGGKFVSDPNSGVEVGDVMASITYISQILMALLMIGMMFQTVTRGASSIKRLNAVLNSKQAIKSGELVVEEIAGDVSFKNVNFRYPGMTGDCVLKDFTIDVHPGDTLAILGTTGSGKTTLVNLIPRFYDVTEGELLIDGVNIKDYDLKSLRQKIGVVFQKTELFTGTIEDNIRWGNKDASFEEVRKACQIAQADNFIMEFNDGYQTVIGEKGSSLSGGQKQRLAIARAILKKPAILIFDDATSALDLATEAALYKELRANMQNTTIFLVAQRVASAKGAASIIVLENGSMVAYGTNEELLANSAVYQDIYNSQLKNGGAK